MDVAVVGAGVIGLTSALRLAEAGLRPLVIERGDPGREASWAAAGILGAQSESHGAGPFFERATCSIAPASTSATSGAASSISPTTTIAPPSCGRCTPGK